MMETLDTKTKSKRKKEPSLYEYYDKLLLMNNDCYLFSIDEARLLMRMDRNKFVNNYIKTGKVPLTLLEDGKKMIRNADLKFYLEQQQRIYHEG